MDRSLNNFPMRLHRIMIHILPLLIVMTFVLLVDAKTHYHDFVINTTSHTMLCKSKEIMTINGQFPGPTLKVRKGDTALITVHNKAHYKITLHWHGLKQPRNPWSDGPEYFTQCGIPPGHNMTYTLIFSDEEGTIWYHAHTDWTRATVHGAIAIYPKEGTTYPFPTPYMDIPIIIGEWYESEVMAVMDQAMREGGDFNDSSAYTLNGKPGDLYNCSESDIFRFQVKQNKTYLVRLINGAITNGHFFGIANHTMTIVGRDGSYVKPFNTDYVWITSGQTIDILFEANKFPGYYRMAASPFSNAPQGKFDATTTAGMIEYENIDEGNSSAVITSSLPKLPDFVNSTAILGFVMKLRSLSSKEHPVDVPMEIDTHLAFVFSLNLIHCQPPHKCEANYGERFASSINNVSFENPSYDILNAYYYNMTDVFTKDFPDYPPLIYNFSHSTINSSLLMTHRSTEVKVLKYNSSVELVFQGSALLTAENHPIHLHGHSFYLVGMGYGNYDPENDPKNFNLVDPPLVNTVGIPTAGWAVARFRTTNPGVWLMHCHMARHLTWGMDMGFIVLDGPTNETSMLPRPTDMPNFCPEKLHASS